MKFIFSTLLLSLATHASEIEYMGEVEYNGKVYHHFQSQEQGNVLIGKAEAERRERAEKARIEEEKKRLAAQRKELEEPKDGVFIFEKARELLTEEGMFQIGVGAGFKQILSEKEILADRELDLAGHLANNNLRPPFGDVGTWTPTKGFDHSGKFAQLYLAYRPHFYRHIRLAYEFEGMDQAKSQERGDFGQPGTGHLTKGHTYSIEHDIWVFPSKTSYVAISTGYFYARNLMSYLYDVTWPETDSLRRPTGKIRFDEAYSRWALGGNYEVPVSDNGPTLTVRKTWITDGPTAEIHISLQYGLKGSRKAVGQFILGFGRKKASTERR